MKRFSLNKWLRHAVLVSTAIVIAKCAGNLHSDKSRPLFETRVAHADPGNGFLWPIPPVQAAATAEPRSELNFEGFMPELNGGVAWLNSSPMSAKSMRGKVVLINFWTYTCINSLRPLPYIKGWATKYKDLELVVIGVHTPEFSFEKEQPNVEAAMREHDVTYPVVMDNNYRIWQAFQNEYWPAFYLIDVKGRIRYKHFGEGDYRAMERAIQELLKENRPELKQTPIGDSVGRGIEAPPSTDQRSPESYLGYRLAERFASSGGLKNNSENTYTTPPGLVLNRWGLVGRWNVNAESAVLVSAPGRIVYRFHSRDLNLVLAPSSDGRPIRFRVRLDGAAPGNDSGVDTSPEGIGIVREPRLYQLIRQTSTVEDRTFEIEFFDPGVHALDFTFG
jgi:thiol-disulfide isomerase/thioredoxin